MIHLGTTMTRAAIVLGVMLLLTLAWAFVESRSLRVRRAVVTSPRVPAEFEGARIAFLADIHAGPYFSQERVRQLVERVNAEKPDLIVMGGDYVGGRAHGMDAFYPEISGLSAPLGVFAVLGNHDYWEGADEARSRLESAGIVLLDNDNVRARRGGVGIRVAGVDDPWEGSPDVETAAADIAKDEFAVLVSHSPDYLAEALPKVRGAFDLVLTGHTHGGQLTALGMWAPLVPSVYGQRYRTGWLAEEGARILVTNGVGTVTAPLRLFAPPEIHVIELRSGPEGVEEL